MNFFIFLSILLCVLFSVLCAAGGSHSVIKTFKANL